MGFPLNVLASKLLALSWCSVVFATSLGSGSGWEQIPPMPTPRSDAGSVALADGTFLVIGGTEVAGAGTQISGVLEQYLPNKGMWTKWNTSLPTPRANFGAALYHNELYVIGGQAKETPGGSIGSVEILNLGTMKWRPGPTLPYSVMGHRVVTLPDETGILVIGGFTYSKIYQRTDYHNESLVLDLRAGSERWRKTKTSLPYRVSDFGVVVAKQANLIYAVGGAATYPGYAHVSVFDPKTEQWTRAGKLNVPRSYPACACIVEKSSGSEAILVVGGMAGDFVPTNSVEIANVVSGNSTLSFTAFDNFPVARGAMAAGTVGTDVIVVGGTAAYMYKL